MKRMLKRIPFVMAIVRWLKIGSNVKDLRDIVLSYQAELLKLAHPNPLCRHGIKCFSQSDEDGITIEILSRIESLQSGTFAEFGVGDGTENNTLVLKALGWRGFWVGGEKLAILAHQPKESFSYIRAWVTRDNVVDLAKEGLGFSGESSIDVISMDLDGNDIYLIEKLLEGGFRPKLFITEYNAKFPPPVRWQIEYDEGHVWRRDDYFGASLCSLADLFERYGFFLVCCNAHTGSNAFFIRNEYREQFSDVPNDVRDIYVAPRYYLYSPYGHPQSMKTIERIFS